MRKSNETPSEKAPDKPGHSAGLRERFRHWSEKTAHAIGTPFAFMTALAVVIIWGVSGPFFGYSDTWQLVINTGTTVVTFLVVFLIQNTQNRDTKVLNLKLDELIRAIEGARNAFVDLDHLTESELEELQGEFTRLGKRFGALVHDDLQNVEDELKSRRTGRGSSTVGKPAKSKRTTKSEGKASAQKRA